MNRRGFFTRIGSLIAAIGAYSFVPTAPKWKSRIWYAPDGSIPRPKGMFWPTTPIADQFASVNMYDDQWNLLPPDAAKSNPKAIRYVTMKASMPMPEFKAEYWYCAK